MKALSLCIFVFSAEGLLDDEKPEMPMMETLRRAQTDHEAQRMTEDMVTFQFRR